MYFCLRVLCVLEHHYFWELIFVLYFVAKMLKRFFQKARRKYERDRKKASDGRCRVSPMVQVERCCSANEASFWQGWPLKMIRYAQLNLSFHGMGRQFRLMTRQDREVVNFKRYRVKNNSKLTNLRKFTRIEGYNGKYGSNPQGI